LPSALSFNLWRDYRPFFGRTFFEACDLLVSSYLLPLGGLLVAIYVGWVWPRRHSLTDLGAGHRQLLWVRSWQLLLRYVAPAAVIIVLLNQAGVFH
jgi:NSS family neurotransmitter:Na+ symporter